MRPFFQSNSILFVPSDRWQSSPCQWPELCGFLLSVFFYLLNLCYSSSTQGQAWSAVHPLVSNVSKWSPALIISSLLRKVTAHYIFWLDSSFMLCCWSTFHYNVMKIKGSGYWICFISNHTFLSMRIGTDCLTDVLLLHSLRQWPWFNKE